MSLRSKAERLLEVMLRVPPLFVIDEILKTEIGLDELYHHVLTNFQVDFVQYESNNGTHTPPPTIPNVAYNGILHRVPIISIVRLLLSVLGCMVALCLFVLKTKQLIIVYMYLMSVGVVILSYWTNISVLKSFKHQLDAGNCTGNFIVDFFKSDTLSTFTSDECYAPIIQNLITQSLLAYVFVNIHLGPRYTLLQTVLRFAFLLPSLVAFAPEPPIWLFKHLPLFSAIIPFALVKFILGSSVLTIFECLNSLLMYSKNYVSHYGISMLVEAEWTRLKVPRVLRTFWFLRAVEHCVIFFVSGMWHEDDASSPYYRLVKFILVTGCDTLIAVLGITSVVSYISNYIGKFFQWILSTEDENDKNFGTVSAIVFYILALQTGLTGLEPEVRFVRLCRNFCLLFTAILHFIHNVVNPLLMSLSASHNPSWRRHIHALAVCAILVLLPSIFMFYLWTTHETSTWLLAVSAFSIEVIVKVFVSLTIYWLFLLDAYRESFWEKLDDYIYYTKAFGNTVEFCFGIFLFFNGAWILLFESGSAIRAVMMCIHAYFNIWCDAKAGWSVFMKRRTAVNKIESLPEADEEQLRHLNDVCAICYQEMRSAKITRCRHFFHGVCLRKWLYVQDRCPLCHEILHAVDKKTPTTPVYE